MNDAVESHDSIDVCTLSISIRKKASQKRYDSLQLDSARLTMARIVEKSNRELEASTLFPSDDGEASTTWRE